VVAAIVRLIAILTVGNIPNLHGDEIIYFHAAHVIADGGGFPGSFRAPGYPTLLAGAFLLGGEQVVAVRLAQGVLGLIPVALVFDLARRHWSRRAAIISALVVALNPTLIHYTHFLWPETLVAALLMAAVYAAARHAIDGRRSWLLAAGVALGCGALTKEVVLYLGPVFVAWVWWLSAALPTRRRLGQVAVLALAMAGTILPWTARNYAVHGRFVLISTARWAPIAMGLLDDPTGGRRRRQVAADLRRALRRAPDEIAREAVARDAALRAFSAATPRWVARQLWDGPRKLFSAETQLGRFAVARWLPDGWESTVRRLTWIEVVFFAASVAAGLVGLWLVPDGRVKPLIVAIVVFFVCVHTIAFSTSRYRVPLLPLLALYVGPLMTGSRVRGRRAWLRAVGAGLCVLWLGGAIASTSRRAFTFSRPDRRPAGQPAVEPFDS
jgi:4-amino-4-deoxy-L-arabinose transferase-like glycosyltransferase